MHTVWDDAPLVLRQPALLLQAGDGHVRITNAQPSVDKGHFAGKVGGVHGATVTKEHRKGPLEVVAHALSSAHSAQEPDGSGHALKAPVLKQPPTPHIARPFVQRFLRAVRVVPAAWQRGMVTDDRSDGMIW